MLRRAAVASLFTLPADLVDGEVLRGFVDQANPEATVLEYKLEGQRSRGRQPVEFIC
jgi:hypothetical protein